VRSVRSISHELSAATPAAPAAKKRKIEMHDASRRFCYLLLLLLCVSLYVDLFLVSDLRTDNIFVCDP
jgi:hypothetical protein